MVKQLIMIKPSIMKAIKANITIPGITLTEFEKAMALYATADQRANEINKAIETEVNEILEKYEDDLQCIDQSRKAAYDIVQSYCSANKSALFSKRRSIGTQDAIAGFRLGTPRLKIRKGKDWNTILISLKDKLPAYVRTTEEPAKDMLLADRNKEQVAPLLIDMGIEVVQEELFYIETKKSA